MVDCPVPSDGADEWLEPDAGRLARPVLRGRWRSNALPLPDVGVDAESGLVHSTHYTAANESDVAHTHEVLHGQEDHVFLDAGYTGVHKREEIVKAQADGAIKTEVRWSVAMKRAKLKGMAEGPLKQLTQALEKVKAQIRARVEHPFHVVKNLFNHKKARYRGLAKNGAQYDTLFALGNLVIAKKALLQSMENSVCEAP